MSSRSRLALLVLFTLGVALRVGNLAALTDDPLFWAPTLDGLYHHHHARGLVFDDWSLPAGVPDPDVRTTPLHRPIGYPLLLAGTYLVTQGSLWAPRILQHGLGLVVGLLALLFARRLRPGDDLAGVVAAGFVWLSPLHIFFESELQAASVTGALLLAIAFSAVALGARRDLRAAAVFGLVLAVATLVRPNLAPLGVLALPGVVALWLSGARARSVGALVVIGALGLALNLGVPVRNQRAGGEAVLTSTNGAVSLLFANHERADGIDNVPPPGTKFTGVETLSPFGFQRFKKTVERNAGRKMSYAELNALCTSEVARFAREHVGDFLGLTLKRAALLVGPRSISNNREVALVLAERPALQLAPGRFALLAPLAVLGAVALLARRREEDARRALYVVATVVFYLAPLTLFFAGSRFRAPLVPLLAVLAGLGVSALVTAARAREGARAVAIGLALGCATWLAAPLAPASRPARHHTQRAVAWQTLERPAQAAAELDRAAAVGGSTVDTLVTRGYLELGRGRAPEAEAAFRQALARRSDVGAHAGLGAALVQIGRHDDAIAALERAVEHDPEHEAALYNLGIARGAANDLAGAEDAYSQLLRAHPDHHRGKTNLASVYLTLGKPERALPLLDAVLVADPDDRNARLNRAIALTRSGKNDAAIGAYRAMLAATPNDVDALTNLGVLLMRVRPEEAVAPLARAAELKPTHAGVLMNHVTALLNVGADAQARVVFEQALTRVAPRAAQGLREAQAGFCSGESPPQGFCAPPSAPR
jgi:Tfp pilus assembly protein PilF